MITYEWYELVFLFFNRNRYLLSRFSANSGMSTFALNIPIAIRSWFLKFPFSRWLFQLGTKTSVPTWIPSRWLTIGWRLKASLFTLSTTCSNLNIIKLSKWSTYYSKTFHDEIESKESLFKHVWNFIPVHQSMVDY